MTLLEHIQTRDLNPDSVGKAWRRKQQAGLLARNFSRDLEPTPGELAVLFGKGQKSVVKTFVQTDKRPAVSASVSATDKPTQTDDTTQTDALADTDDPTQTDGQELDKSRTLVPGRSAVLVCVMIVCAAVSLSNMYDISSQIKPNRVDALLITGLFSLAPFALLYAGVSRWASWLVSGICIGFEVFCNTAGMYRGLAGLGRSGKPYEVWEPGGFIDTVSRVTTLEPRPCALAISFGMAGIVAAVFLTCLIELKK